MLAIFLDLETTGLDFRRHRVLEIAFKVVDVSTHELKLEFQSVIDQPEEVWKKRDPASIEVNGFCWEDLARGKSEEDVAKEITQHLTKLHVERGSAVFICQNPAFDRSFFTQLVDVYTQEQLHWPYHWLDLASMYWTVRVQEALKNDIAFPEKINLSKNEIAKYYTLPPEAHPHRAMNGVDHLIQCYCAVLGVAIQVGSKK